MAIASGMPFSSSRRGSDRGVGHAPIEHARRTASQIGATRLIIQGNPDAADFYLAWGDTLNRQSPDFTRGTDSRAQPQAHTSDLHGGAASGPHQAAQEADPAESTDARANEA